MKSGDKVYVKVVEADSKEELEDEIQYFVDRVDVFKIVPFILKVGGKRVEYEGEDGSVVKEDEVYYKFMAWLYYRV